MLSNIISKWKLRREVLLWLIAALFLFAGFVFTTREVREADLGQPELVRSLDHMFLNAAMKIRTPILNMIMTDITALGSTTNLVLLCVFVTAYFIIQRARKSALLFSLGALTSAALTQIFKHYFERARPPLADRIIEVGGYSYPSGHSVSSACIYLMIALLVSKAADSYQKRVLIRAALAFLVLLIGISRIYLGAHYFSDVIAGFLAGAGCTAVIQAFDWHTLRETHEA